MVALRKGLWPAFVSAMTMHPDPRALSGLWSAAPTAFCPDGALDEGAFAAHLGRWGATLGLAGLIVGGEEGEGPALTHDERKRLFSTAAEVAAGRCGLILDCSDPQEGRMADLMALAGALSVPCMLSLPRLPGARAQEATLLAFVTRAAREAPHGLVLDIHPGAGYLVAPRLAARLAETPGILALRYVAPASLRAELARHLDGQVPFSGGDEAIWLEEIETRGATLHLGGLAPLMLQSAACPHVAQYAAAALAGRREDAVITHRALDPLRAAIAEMTPAEKPIAAAKHWLALTGFPCGPVRLPWLPLTAREEGRIERAFADHAPA